MVNVDHFFFKTNGQFGPLLLNWKTLSITFTEFLTCSGGLQLYHRKLTHLFMTIDKIIYIVTLCILMGSSFWFDTINFGWSIVYS